MTAESNNIDTTPRTPDQVRFVPHLPWEEVAAIYREAMKNPLVMSYGARAQEVVNCARTALPPDEHRDKQLECIGVLLVLWEGVIMLYEDMLKERDVIIEARGELLKFARQKITELQPAPEAPGK